MGSQQATVERSSTPSSSESRTRGGWAPSGVAAERRQTHARRGTPRGEKTRRKLIDAARKVFERDGYFEANVEGIVAEAGVARGSFYTYFPAKIDVFRVVVSEVGERIDLAVSATGDGRTGDPVAALSAANARYVEVYRQHAVIYGLIEQVATIDPDVHAFRLGRRRRDVLRIAGLICRWQRRGVADLEIDPETVAAALVSMTSNFCYWWFVGADPQEPAQAVQTLNDLWVRAVGLRHRPRRGWEVPA